MNSRVNECIRYHDAGFNCAQSVACAYADLVGCDEETVFRATEGLGLGLGGMEGTCGALSGACVLAGLKNSGGDLQNPVTKAQTYQLSKELVRRFQETAGATICKDLKGIETGEVLRPCPLCITDAAALVEEVLFPEVFGE
ncbi:MAG: C_GCAxxG_C_C family protein [Clostridia bacterium]|nr:C_GCAxxG_C_C family protein [Clostridia bacterium]